MMVVELPGLMDKIIATPGLQIIATLISTFQNDCVCVCVRGICVWGGVCVEWIPWLCELIYEKYN